VRTHFDGRATRTRLNSKDDYDWSDFRLPNTRDIRRLRLQHLPPGERFETRADARRYNAARVSVLATLGSQVVDVIDGCDGASERCFHPGCALCSRDYRISNTSELIGLAHRFRGQHWVATLFLDEIARGHLASVDVKRAHAALRKRLDRSGFRGSVLAGGTEAAWIAQDACWILHVHLLAIGVRPFAWRELRTTLSKSRVGIPLKVERLRDEAEQLSYLTKFFTYHRPLARRGAKPGPALPLPPRRLVELMDWWSQRSMQDFSFLYGARRRGGRIYPEI
jgi:hypothetical protein